MLVNGVVVVSGFSGQHDRHFDAMRQQLKQNKGVRKAVTGKSFHRIVITLSYSKQRR